MRLFEFAHGKFQDDLRNVLMVLQGRANDEGTTSVVPWPAVNNMLKSYGYSEVTADMMTKIKDQVDKDGELIQDIKPEGIVLKTDLSTPEEPSGLNPNPRGGKSVDQMAHNAVSKGL